MIIMSIGTFFNFFLYRKGESGNPVADAGEGELDGNGDRKEAHDAGERTHAVFTHEFSDEN